GAVFTPLNVSLRRDDLAATLARIPTRHLVITRELLTEHRDTILAAGTVEAVELEDLLDKSEKLGEGHNLPEYHWRADELSWILFSGATTGLPKAIRLPHGYGLASGLRLVRAIRLTEEDRFFSVLQLCHGWLNF